MNVCRFNLMCIIIPLFPSYLQFGEFSYTRATPQSVFENDLKKSLAQAAMKAKKK